MWCPGGKSETVQNKNGCFEIYFGERKRKLTSRRIEMGMYKLNLVRTNVIPIINTAWKSLLQRQIQILKQYTIKAGGLWTMYYYIVLNIKRQTKPINVQLIWLRAGWQNITTLALAEQNQSYMLLLLLLMNLWKWSFLAK